MAWSNDSVLEFIDLYRAEQILWDPKHPCHRNRSEVNDAWERIKNSFSITDCSIVDLKKKKESLMTSFRTHCGRKKKCPGYRPSWFAYSLMESFLGGKYECDSTAQDDAEFFETTSYNSNQAEDPLHFQNFVPNSSTPERHNAKRPRPSKQSFKRPSSANLQTKKEIDETQNYNFIDSKSEADECELYCQLLAKKLRKLDEHQRDVVMHEIDNIIFRAKMESAQVNYSTSTSSPVPRKMRSPVFIVTASSNNQFDEENSGFQEHTQT